MGACERFAKRSVVDSENPSAETIWSVWVDAEHPTIADESEAYAIVAPLIPTTYTFPSGKIAVLQSVNVTDIDERSWDFKLSYARLQRKEENYIEYEFDIGLQEVTLTHALDTTPFTGGGRTAPDFKKGVNISSDGKVQGVSVGQPSFTFSVTKYWPIAAITRAYQLQVKSLAGKFNSADFYGLPAGSVKFMGARGKPSGQKWPVTYRFEHSENETGLTVGDITGINRKGWQYLDVYRRVIGDSSSKKKIEVPHSVYVHTLAPGEGNFSILGIGT